MVALSEGDVDDVLLQGAAQDGLEEAVGSDLDGDGVVVDQASCLLEQDRALCRYKRNN